LMSDPNTFFAAFCFNYYATAFGSPRHRTRLFTRTRGV
jgi:hypothetical protein